MSVRVTVITPTLNSERFFPETLRSIHGDVPPSVEVEHIVVDGGSTDGTVELARAHNCQVITGEDDGLYDAMNIGLRRATGDVISILNSDDTFLPGTIATIAAWFQDRQSDWMVGGIRWTDGSGRKLADLPAPPAWMGVEAFASLGWNCVHHQATFITRDLYRRVGEYDLSFPYAADYELLARTLRQMKFDRAGRPLATFRRHGQNASIRGQEALVEEGRRIQEVYGPQSEVRRRSYRYALKIWLNAASPAWLIAKKTGRA
jgi:glycosyltransferase involved in cell wall biosynthesis